MTEKTDKKPICIVNEKGATVMAMNSMKRDGDKITINGVLMGSWPADMYVNPEDMSRMVGMILKSPSVIGYVLSLPVILPRWRKAAKKKAQALEAKKLAQEAANKQAASKIS